MITESRAYIYAKWCADESNPKAPLYVKKQAVEWLRIADGQSDEAIVSDKAFKKICGILKLMVHPDLSCSMYEGLEDYACFFITALFCTRLKSDESKRYYTTGVLEIGRKNFKTFNSGVIFILLMLTEPNFSRFFSVAPDLKLSSELKIAIRKIIKASPALYNDKVFKILRSEIRCLLTESEYTPLAYSEDKMDGKLANAFLADECGGMDSYPIEAMRSSQITLLNKLGIIISSQYPNDNNGMIDEIDISKKTLDGFMPAVRRFSLLYEPDDWLLKNDEWKSNDLVIYQSNPVSIEHEHIFKAIKDIRTMAVLYEDKRENYLCKHNNIKYKGLGVEGYIPIDKVRECTIAQDLDFWKGKSVYIGLDLSLSEDNTAVAMITESGGKVYSKVFGFIPADKVEGKSMKENFDYRRAIAQGVCFKCGGEIIDYNFIEEFILGLEDKYGVQIIQIGYDRWNAISSIQKLEAKGYECVEVKQHSSVLHMPTKLLKEMVLEKTFCYDANILLENAFQNSRCTADTNLNKYVNKKKSAGKVDMVLSLITALYLFQQETLYGCNYFVAQT